MSRKPSPRPPARGNTVWIYALLLAATLALYVRTVNFDFVNFDDPDYVTANPHVRGGFTAGNIAWAFTSGSAANWFPLTRLSHMLDYQLFGAWSGGHHITNVVLHAVAVLLLFGFLHRATGRRWLSAWVALIFAVHPLHVESVAWIAERKDVLSAALAMLALWSYVRWAERPSRGRQCLTAAAFALGLTAKPMLVTLPAVFLLLDVWPLGRGPRWREKIPLFLMSAASALVTYLVQQASGAVRTAEDFPLLLRVENAAVSAVIYIWKWFWPARLAVFYPYPAEIPLWQAALAALSMAAISVLVWRVRRSRPYLATGWCWYLIMLAPVSGLVQVGAQARADRYMYLPSIGLSIMLAWGAAEIFARYPQIRPALAALTAASCAGAAAIAWVQLDSWRDSRALFRHAVDVTADNYLAHHNLGVALAAMPEGANEAIAEYREALRIKPDYLRALTDLGSAYAKLGRLADAVSEFRGAIALDPNLAIPHNNLGNAYAQSGHWNEAIPEYQSALRLDPDYADARNGLAEAEYSLGLEFAKGGKRLEAIAHLEAALAARSDYPEAHNNLGVVLSQDPGRLNEAIGHFEAALRIDPNYVDAHVNLGLAWSQMPGRIPDAIAQLEAADRLQPDPEIRRMLEKLRAEVH
ncbi:MAG TPA: tetratricopeptide repeat protein [Bryobacteraceae bacterium]|nr:tetratricopeptide repeat protein [Bryobacteraceae bacterium]